MEIQKLQDIDNETIEYTGCYFTAVKVFSLSSLMHLYITGPQWVNITEQAWQTASGAASRLAPSQRETSLQSNVVFHWLGANLESALSIRYVVNDFW